MFTNEINTTPIVDHSASTKPLPQADLRKDELRSLAAAPLDVRFYSDDSGVLRIAGALTAEIAASRVRGVKRGEFYIAVRRFVTCLLCNAFENWTLDPRTVLAINLRRDSYDDCPDFGYNAVKAAVDALQALGYLIKLGHHWSTESGKGVASRFQATDKLVDLFRSWDLSVVQVTERAPLVEIRPSKKEKKRAKRKGVEIAKRLPWPRRDRALKARRIRNLRFINDALRKQFQGLAVSDADLVEALGQVNRQVNLRSHQLHRVFTSDPFHGGRFVGAYWQNIPTSLRAQLRIAKPGSMPEETVEVDYSSLHPMMLYASKGLRVSRDLYEIYPDKHGLSKVLRPALKQILLSLINAEARSDAEKSFVKFFNKEIYPDWLKRNFDTVEVNPNPWEPIDGRFGEVFPGAPPWREVFQDVIDHHKPIAEFLHTGAGHYLMFEESEIAEQVMLRCYREHGVMPLPLHDGFIVPRSLASPLRNIMDQVFASKYASIEPSIAIKSVKSALPFSPPTKSCRYTRLLDHWLQTSVRIAEELRFLALEP